MQFIQYDIHLVMQCARPRQCVHTPLCTHHNPFPDGVTSGATPEGAIKMLTQIQDAIRGWLYYL